MGRLDKSTALGKSIVNDYINWRSKGSWAKPYPPIGNKEHFGAYDGKYKQAVKTTQAFSNACKKLIPHALEQMNQEDFDAFLATLDPDDPYDISYRSYCNNARDKQDRSEPPEKNKVNSSKKKKQKKPSLSQDDRSSAPSIEEATGLSSGGTTYHSEDFLESVFTDTSFYTDESIGDEETGDLYKDVKKSNISANATGGFVLKSPAARARMIGTSDSSEAVAQMPIIADCELSKQFSSLQVSSAPNDRCSQRAPMLLVPFNRKSCLVRFELCGGISDQMNHKFEFRDDGKRFVYLNKVPNHKVDPSAMLNMESDSSSYHFAFIEAALKNHLAGLQGLQKDQQGSYWEEKFSLQLPFQCDQLFYDKAGKRVTRPIVLF